MVYSCFYYCQADCVLLPVDIAIYIYSISIGENWQKINCLNCPRKNRSLTQIIKTKQMKLHLVIERAKLLAVNESYTKVLFLSFRPSFFLFLLSFSPQLSSLISTSKHISRLIKICGIPYLKCLVLSDLYKK